MNCGENDWWWFWRKKKGKCARSLGYIVRAMGSGCTFFFFVMNIFKVIDKTKNFRLTQTSGDDLINYWISYYGYHLVSVCLKKKKKRYTWHPTLNDLQTLQCTFSRFKNILVCWMVRTAFLRVLFWAKVRYSLEGNILSRLIFQQETIATAIILIKDVSRVNKC